MDFSNRNPQAVSNPVVANPVGKKNHNNDNDSKWTRIGIAAVVAAAIVLIIAAILAISASNSNGESKYVDTTKLQAVFLNTGQVYFGNVKVLNSKYFVLTNIYYLQTSNSSGTAAASSSSTAANNVSLVKLGCELHQPYDQMVINRDQVTFWENLQGGGQVAKAVSTFQKQNPNGQKCTEQTSSAATTTGNSAQGAGSSTTPSTTTTTPATTPATTKP